MTRSGNPPSDKSPSFCQARRFSASIPALNKCFSVKRSFFGIVAPRKSVPQIAFVVIDLVAYQQREKLLLECLSLVVLPLILDVGDHVLELRLAHSEGSVTILPCKTGERGELGVNPGGRTAFDQLRGFGGCHCCGSAQQNMDVIIDAADFKRLHPVLACDSSQKCPDSLLDIRSDPEFSKFCAENDVVMQ